MNPESLDSSIQSALSALFPPFDATAPIVLSQLFRTIEERYHGDALQCLLDFLIPSKHLLESVQQAACAGYSDVVFRCEGWPLCLHDKTVIQLAPVNPLLLRPGDFYLQVEPFGDQAARIVLKSLLEEGCREVEETPIPETSYPCIFTEEWLQDINEGRHGTPLSQCLLGTDQGVIKLPWAQIAVPEFLDKPKIMHFYRETPPEPKQNSAPSNFNSSTLPVEAIFQSSKHPISASLRTADSSKLIKMDHARRLPKSCSKPLIKPVGWVSPNTWDRPSYREIEGDYVDLVDVAKERDQPNPPSSVPFKPVRPPPPVPQGNPCGRTLQFAEEPCTPCCQRKLRDEDSDEDLKCRYRDSYMAALRNPVTFERGNVDLLAALEEVGLSEDFELRSNGPFDAQKPTLGHLCNHCNKPVVSEELRHGCEPKSEIVASQPTDPLHAENLMKEPPMVLKSTPGLSYSQKVHMKLISHQSGLSPTAYPGSEDFLENCHGDFRPHQNVEVVKPSGKHKVKVRSLSTVSETSKGNPPLYKLNNRSHSDICPETVSSVMQCKKGELLDQVTQKLEKRKSPKKDALLCRSETPSTVGSPDSKLHNSKISQLPHPPASIDLQNCTGTKESRFSHISGLLELGIICLPGSRDRTGRAVVEVHAGRQEWNSPLVSAQSLCELLLYLHSIPRKEVQELGMTLVINARKKLPSPPFYKALLMAQEQALHAVHSIVMLVDKETFPRPEKQPGLQMDTVTSMKALNKTVESSQLTSDLGGTFPYSSSDWLQFHQRLVAFMTDLRGADCMLQKAIKKVNSSKKTDTVQEVQQCIHEQGALMKEVLEDTRLVTLQREGGALLARMRKEEFKFPQSEDYRDSLDSVTSLYNQVEEKLHTLVMRSNESLQHLEFLHRLREMEAKITTVGMWFRAEAEQRLKDSYATDDTLVGTETALQHFELFFTDSKEKQQQALTLVMEADKIIVSSDSSPSTDVFCTLMNTFKFNVDDFMLRAEQRLKDLKALVHVHHFSEQASSLAKECSHFLEKVEQGCYSAQTLSTLQMYEERFDGEFSTQHFQDVKAKACAVGSGASGAMIVWNAAWILCQEVRQRLGEMQKKKGSDKEQIQQSTAVNPQEGVGGTQRGKIMEVGEDEGTLIQRMTSQTEAANISERQGKNTSDEFNNHYLKQEVKEKDSEESQAHESPIKKKEINPAFPQNNHWSPETKQKPREHHSEADLRCADSPEGGNYLPLHHPLGRSLSEGSAVSSRFSVLSSLSPLNRHKHCQSRTQQLEPNLPPIQNLSVSQNESLQSGNLSCEANRDSSEEAGEGCKDFDKGSKDSRSPETLLTPTENNADNVLKLRRIMEELLLTEREYVKALGYVREHYFPELERADVPQDLRGQRGSIFGNLEKLHDFHKHHFLDEMEGCVNEPFRVGRCFLRHRESFALYALYSKNKPQSDRLLICHGQAFFKQKQQSLGDKMDLWSYLLKPVQRISKYSLLLQDMMRECGPTQTREMAEVKAALEVINFQLRHGNNLLAMDAIQLCDVNLKEQGQIIRQDEFLVTFRKKKCFRHIFLFQELVLFSKTRRTDVGNDSYVYKQSFKTSDIGMTQNCGDSGLCFEIWFRKRKTQDTYTLQAVSREVKEGWTKDLERILWEQAVHNREVRMQERVFMGIGNKPFIDIQPSDAAIHDRAVNYVLMGRDNKAQSSAGTCGSQGGLLVGRPKSLGSGSSSSSSSSSGRGSLPPSDYLCGPKRRVVSGGLGGYSSPSGVLEEDDLDHESGNHNLLLDSSESSGESVSGFSSSSHSYHSAVGGEVEDASSLCSSTITIKEAVATHGAEVTNKLNALAETPEKKQPPVAPKPQQPTKDVSCGEVQNSAGKSTEV